MDARRSDTVVAGAGPAGATMARLLALRGRRVTLVDPGTRVTDRLEIVSPACCPVLEALGIAHLLQEARLARACLGIRRRWGTAELQIDDFLRRPGGRGYVIDRIRFDAELRELAMDAGVEVVAGRVVAARRRDGVMAVTVDIAAGRCTVLATQVIDATGRPAAVARRMGARRLVTDTRVAERADDGAAASSRDPTWLDVEGDSNGWFYRISGPDGRREHWAVSRPRARARLRSRVNASSTILLPAAGDGWIAIGDAAAAFDPVTSQGLANALSTALVAAGAILSARGLDDEACQVYADAVTATFRHSEAGRRRVYEALTP